MAERRGNNTESIIITPVETVAAAFLVIGTMPLIVNRMSEKARRVLTLPDERKNAAERAATLKHQPLEEFRASPYLSEDPQAPTYLVAPAIWFKKAMQTAALDLPGATKTQIGRLVWVEGEYVPLWGIPELLMSVVRQAGMDHTPDVRTRTILPAWASVVSIRWVHPLLNETKVANLLAAGGMISGVGDWRQQKGAGNYGQYRLASSAEDEEFRAITAAGGYPAQTAAMDEPHGYDRESREMLEWVTQEIKRRGKTST